MFHKVEIKKNEMEMKQPQEEKLTIQDELRQAKEDLGHIWQKVLPLSSDKVYPLEEKTLSVLISTEFAKITDEKVINKMLAPEFSNPFYLSAKQHGSLVVALSVINTIVDEMIVGFTSPRPSNYSSEWKAPQERADVTYIRCNFHYIAQQDWAVLYHDVPVHFENHARIMGRRTRDQEYEEIIENIPAGEARTRSILERLVKPFIRSFNNVAVLSTFMQKFCDKLIPTDEFSCCIDARTRQAFDFAFSYEIGVPTFSEFLNDAINLCPEDKQDSYFYIMAYLMQQHWRKKYKKDTGTNGICKDDGVLTSESYELILQGILNTVLEINCSNDFLYAYEIVPKELRLEYIRLITKQNDFFKSFVIIWYKDEAQFLKILKEKHDDFSTLNFILTQCDYDVAEHVLFRIKAPLLETIDDIWTKTAIFKYIDSDNFNSDYLELFLQKITAHQLEEMVQDPKYNPFDNQVFIFSYLLTLIGNKLHPQSLFKLLLDARINHHKILSHIRNFDSLKALLPAPLLLDIYLSKGLLPRAFQGENRPVYIARIVNLIIEVASEDNFKNENIYDHLMHAVDYKGVATKTNFLGCFILRNNDKQDSPHYISILSRLPPSILMKLIQHLEFKFFTISLTLLTEIIRVLPDENIDDIFSMNFKISEKIKNEKCVEDLEYLLSRLKPNRMLLLIEHFPMEKIKQLGNDPKLYLNSVLEKLERGHSNFYEFLIRVKPGLRIAMASLTPLMIAAQTGHIKGTKLLLESSNDIPLNAHESHYGWTALHYAVMKNNIELLELLLNAKSEKNSIDINALNKQGVSPLVLAADLGHLESAKLLLSTGKANPHLFTNNKWTALHYAAMKGNDEMVALLLEATYEGRKINPNFLNADFVSPLYLAAENGHIKTSTLLLNTGKIDINPPKNTPLYQAILNGYLEVVNLLLQAGANPNILINFKGDFLEGPHGLASIRKNPTTFLEIAAHNAHIDIVKALLNHNAKPFNKAPSHPNVSSAFLSCCALSFKTTNKEEFAQSFHNFKKMDAKIDQLLKKAQFYKNPTVADKLYAIYDDYLNHQDFSIINETLLSIENNLNEEHAKTEGLCCRGSGSLVLFVGEEQTRFYKKIKSKENLNFFVDDTLSRDEAYNIAIAPAKKVVKQGTMHCFKDINHYKDNSESKKTTPRGPVLNNSLVNIKQGPRPIPPRRLISGHITLFSSNTHSLLSSPTGYTHIDISSEDEVVAVTQNGSNTTSVNI